MCNVHYIIANATAKKKQSVRKGENNIAAAWSGEILCNFRYYTYNSSQVKSCLPKFYNRCPSYSPCFHFEILRFTWVGIIDLLCCAEEATENTLDRFGKIIKGTYITNHIFSVKRIQINSVQQCIHQFTINTLIVYILYPSSCYCFNEKITV